MADSFEDLWNSAAPSKPATSTQTLGAARLAPTPAHAASSRKQDVFSLLASTPPTSRPPSRPIAPVLNASPAAKASLDSDAFSVLLGGPSTTKPGAAMSIAERQAAVERERMAKLLKDSKDREKTAQVWDGLDVLAAGVPHFATQASNFISASPANGRQQPQPAAPLAVAGQGDDWGLSDFTSPSPPDDPQTSSPSVFDSLGDFVAPTSGPVRSKPSSPPNGLSARPASLFETLDDLTAPPPRSHTGTPGDFDFGNREYTGSSSARSSTDDILGALAQPPSVPRRPSPVVPAVPAAAWRAAGRERAGSPPPHVVGQIVEMGFSVQQARVALAATESGRDVQQALDMLLASGAAGATGDGDGSPGGSPTARDPGAEQDWDRDRRREEAREREEREREERHRWRRRGPPGMNGAGAGTPPTGEAATASELQERADRLLAQASELGMSMFSRANAFWKEGREKVVKVYEERAGTSAAGVVSGGRGSPAGERAGPARPRWMADIPPEVGHAEVSPTGELGGFKDDEATDRAPSKLVATSRSPPPPPSRHTNLFDTEPSTYTSPARRRQGPAPPTTSAVPSRAALPRAASCAPQHVHPALPPLRERTLVSTSPSALAAADKHKMAGTEMFKLGRYAEADAAYTLALSSLPEGHLLRVPLHTNRAAARLRTGDAGGATADCDAALALVGDGYDPEKERPLPGLDLAGAVVKALRRRAEAAEARERWVEAKRDWEALGGLGWATAGRADAMAGAARCRRMVEGQNPPPKSSKPALVRSGPPVVSRLTSSDAVEKLRAANVAQDEEDTARHALKDGVDARLIAWRGGKETNLRALIASLDSVLWPELGWNKVSMAELVSNAQVKVRYTRAIAKLHPDKLNTSNTTLEQRMIANGVFAALNDAWIAFKQ